jgi:hypothetical protein
MLPLKQEETEKKREKVQVDSTDSYVGGAGGVEMGSTIVIEAPPRAS